MATHRMTPKRRAALKKAQAASARKRRGKGKGKLAAANRRIARSQVRNRGKMALVSVAAGAALYTNYKLNGRKTRQAAPRTDHSIRARKVSSTRGPGIVGTQRALPAGPQRALPAGKPRVQYALPPGGGVTTHFPKITYPGGEYQRARRRAKRRSKIYERQQGYNYSEGRTFKVSSSGRVTPTRSRRTGRRRG